MGLSAEDRFEIEDLMIRYTWLKDVGPLHEEEFLALFTEDAILESPTQGHYEGVEGLREFARHDRTSGSKTQIMRHVLSNFLVDGAGDRATLKVYMIVFFTQMITVWGNDRPPTLSPSFVGHYECDVRKVNGTWRLATRILYSDRHSGTPFDLSRVPWQKLPPGQPKTWPPLWWRDPKYVGLITESSLNLES